LQHHPYLIPAIEAFLDTPTEARRRDLLQHFGVLAEQHDIVDILLVYTVGRENSVSAGSPAASRSAAGGG